MLSNSNFILYLVDNSMYLNSINQLIDVEITEDAITTINIINISTSFPPQWGFFICQAVLCAALF